MDELKLARCPFCGGRPEYRTTNYVGAPWGHVGLDAMGTTIVCKHCGCTIPSRTATEDAEKAWNTRAERTCWYLPDEHRNIWDKDDIEWECEEAECFDGSDCSCSECGYTMMGVDDGWFDYEDTDSPNGLIEGCVPVPLFKFCPNCGARVERLVPVWRVVKQ